jgi:hypothetical protein
MILIGMGNGMAMSTLFRIVLSRVPTDLAGVGGGVLTTTQQTSLALGVAVFGSLFAGLSTSGPLGFEGAFVLVVGLLAVLAVVVTALSRKLPDPR